LFVELIWGEVAKRLMQAPGLVTLVPGEQGILEPAEFSGQIVDVVELVVVGTERAFDAAVTLGVVRPVEVVGEPQFGDGLSEIAEELRAAVGLNCLDGEREARDDLVEEACAILAGQAGSEVDDAFAGKAVDSAELEDGPFRWGVGRTCCPSERERRAPLRIGRAAAAGASCVVWETSLGRLAP
jgi:hypothetical protein